METMTMKKTALAVSLCLALCLFMGAKACDSSDAAGVAGKVSLDVATVLHAGADAIDQARVSGGLSKDNERLILQIEGNVADLNGVYIGCIKGVRSVGNSATSYLTCASTFATAVDSPTFLVNAQIKDPATLQLATDVISKVQGILGTAESVLTSLAHK